MQLQYFNNNYHQSFMGATGAVSLTLSFLSGLWIPATLLCCIPWVQKRECNEGSVACALTVLRDAVSALGHILPRKMVDGA